MGGGGSGFFEMSVCVHNFGKPETYCQFKTFQCFSEEKKNP